MLFFLWSLLRKIGLQTCRLFFRSHCHIQCEGDPTHEQAWLLPTPVAFESCNPLHRLETLACTPLKVWGGCITSLP